MAPASVACLGFALQFLLFSTYSLANDACYDEDDTSCAVSALQTQVVVKRAAKASRHSKLDVAAIANRMQLSHGNPLGVLAGCIELGAVMLPGEGITAASPDFQNAVVQTGAAESAIKAMQANPNDFALGFACAHMLEFSCAWNAVNQEVLGAAGGLEAALSFYKRFPDNPLVLSSFSSFGFFMDFDPRNVRIFYQLGGLDFFFDEARKHYSSNMMGVLQCICSTQSTHKENLDRMVALGYFPLTMKGMQNFSDGINRGEAVFVMSGGLSENPIWQNEMYAEGVISEILRLMADEPKSYDLGTSLDPLGHANKAGMTRIMYSSLSLLGTLAKGNATRRDAIYKAGGVQAIVDMLQHVGDLHAEVSFGSFDVLPAACDTLGTLLGGEGEPNMVTVPGLGARKVVSELMSQRSHQIPACGSFLALTSQSGSGM